MPREKVKFAMRIKPETQELVRQWYGRDNCQSQNEFIEKAIHLAAEESSMFLPSALVAALRATVRGGEDRVSRLLFKLAVEMSMMMNVLAIGLEIDADQMDRLRGQCVQAVKRSNGGISFKDTVKERQT